MVGDGTEAFLAAAMDARNVALRVSGAGGAVAAHDGTAAPELGLPSTTTISTTTTKTKGGHRKMSKRSIAGGGTEGGTGVDGGGPPMCTGTTNVCGLMRHWDFSELTRQERKARIDKTVAKGKQVGGRSVWWWGWWAWWAWWVW